MFSTNYAKNTVKHLKPIVKVMADAGILTQGLLSLQTMDGDTLDDHPSQQHQGREVRGPREGVPRGRPAAVRRPHARAARRDPRVVPQRPAAVHRPRGIGQDLPDRMLLNSPMNDPEYRAANRIEIAVTPGSNEPLVVSTSSFTRADHAAMLKLREVYLMCENHGVLRQVSRFVRQETGIREADFYDGFCRAALANRAHWPAAAFVFDKGSALMVPPVSWKLFVDDVRAYLTDEIGLQADSALETVLTVQHALIPAPGREFPLELHLAHDFAAWHAAIVRTKDDGNRTDWPALGAAPARPPAGLVRRRRPAPGLHSEHRLNRRRRHVQRLGAAVAGRPLDAGVAHGRVKAALPASELLDDRCEQLDVADAEVGDSHRDRHVSRCSAISGDSSDRQKRRCERVLNGRGPSIADDVRGRRVAIIGHDHGLHECVQFERLCAPVRLLVDEGHRAIEAVWLPAGFVSLAVAEGPSEHRQSDRVSVTSGVTQRTAPVDADEDRKVQLQRPHRAYFTKLIVLALK